MNNENTVGKILKVIGGIIIVVGIIFGLIIGSRAGRFGLIPSVYIIVTTFVSGMLFIGFAEIIKLLHEINLKLNGNEKEVEKEDVELCQKEHDNNIINWEADSRDKAQIQELFKDNNQSVKEIIQTPKQFIYAVKTDGAIKLVETGGFKPKLLNIEEYPEIKEWVQEKI
jgi:hypothetical protein